MRGLQEHRNIAVMQQFLTSAYITMNFVDSIRAININGS